MTSIKNVALKETAGSPAQNPNKPCPPDQPNCEKKLLGVENIGLKNLSATNDSTKCWIA